MLTSKLNSLVDILNKVTRSLKNLPLQNYIFLKGFVAILGCFFKVKISTFSTFKFVGTKKLWGVRKGTD